jgi:hypothetical protein
MESDDRLTLLGNVEEMRLELALPPEQVLARIRAAAPPDVPDGGLFASPAGFRADVRPPSFSVWKEARRGRNPRLEGSVEPVGAGSRVRYRVRVSGVNTFSLAGFVAFVLSVPIILSFVEEAFPQSLCLYAFLIPFACIALLLAVNGQRACSRATLRFFRGLFEDVTVC